MYWLRVDRGGMQLVEERLRSHLLEDESVQDIASGRLLEDAVRGQTTVGLTDRRLLCVGSTGEFVAVRYDYICSIRSRRRTRVQYQSHNDRNRLLHLVGGLLAMAVLVAIGFVTAAVGAVQAVLTLALAVTTVGVATAVERVRKRSTIGRTSDPIVVGSGILALLALLSVGLVSASVFMPVFILVTVGGLGLVAYAAQHREELRGFELDRHQETLVTINTIDGESVHLAVDTDSDLDRELSACVHRNDPAPVELPTVRTPSD